MPGKECGNVTQRYGRELNPGPFVLRLFVAGASPASTRAIARLSELCEESLEERFDVEVIDIFQQPDLAEGQQILATPTLIKLLPAPLQRFIGDLEGLEDELLGSGVRPRGVAPQN